MSGRPVKNGLPKLSTGPLKGSVVKALNDLPDISVIGFIFQHHIWLEIPCFWAYDNLASLSSLDAQTRSLLMVKLMQALAELRRWQAFC